MEALVTFQNCNFLKELTNMFESTPELFHHQGPPNDETRLAQALGSLGSASARVAPEAPAAVEFEAKEKPVDLYGGLIKLDRIPPREVVDGLLAVEVSFLDDFTLEVNGTRVPLSQQTLAVFNALASSAEPLGREGIYDRGFSYYGSDSAQHRVFEGAMAELRESLEEAAAINLVRSIGIEDEAIYALYPNIHFDDLREEMNQPSAGTQAPEAEAGEEAEEPAKELPERTAEPEATLPEKLKIIKIQFCKEGIVMIAGSEVSLSPNEIAILKTFLSRPGDELKRSDFDDGDFYHPGSPGAKDQAFSRVMLRLRYFSKAAAGVELIKRIGVRGSTKYRLNPDLSVREIEDPEDEARWINPGLLRKRQEEPTRDPTAKARILPAVKELLREGSAPPGKKLQPVGDNARVYLSLFFGIDDDSTLAFPHGSRMISCSEIIEANPEGLSIIAISDLTRVTPHGITTTIKDALKTIGDPRIVKASLDLLEG